MGCKFAEEVLLATERRSQKEGESMLIASSSLTDQAFKEAFVEGRLAIDCLEIKLTRNGPGEPSSLTCTGWLQASPENGLEARLVIARGAHQPYDMFAAMHEQAELRSGKLLPPSHYFALDATDVSGNVWRNPSASVHIDHRPDAFIVTVSCDGCAARRRPKGPSARRTWSSWTNSAFLTT